MLSSSMDPGRLDTEKVGVGKKIKLWHLKWQDSLK